MNSNINSHNRFVQYGDLQERVSFPPARALLLIDSRDRDKSLYPDPNNFIIGGNNPSGTPLDGMLMISPYRFTMKWTTPPINDYNNVIYFNYNGVRHSVTIETGWYTPTDFLTSLTTKMTAEISGALFDYTATVRQDMFIIDVTLGNFYFEPHDYITNLFNPPLDNVPRTTMTVGPVELIYTRYFDIISYNLLSNAIVKPTNIINNKRDIIARINLKDTNKHYIDVLLPPQDITMDPNRRITQLDIQLLDEYGNLLWLENSRQSGDLVVRSSQSNSDFLLEATLST